MCSSRLLELGLQCYHVYGSFVRSTTSKFWLLLVQLMHCMSHGTQARPPRPQGSANVANGHW
jgi:hypothetical protein